MQHKHQPKSAAVADAGSAKTTTEEEQPSPGTAKRPRKTSSIPSVRTFGSKANSLVSSGRCRPGVQRRQGL